jgi:hypothetical protein
MADKEKHAATLDEYLRGLEGLDYPTSRRAVINRASDTGGLDNEVLHVLEQLPDRTYDSREDVMAAVREVYRSGSTLAGAGPAAPSGLDSRDKNLVKDMADAHRGEPYTKDGDEGDTDRRSLG